MPDWRVLDIGAFPVLALNEGLVFLAVTSVHAIILLAHVALSLATGRGKPLRGPIVRPGAAERDRPDSSAESVTGGHCGY